jgi:hypothetical protein
VKKSYETLIREHDDALTEQARLEIKVKTLANSIQKRQHSEVYKKALTFLNKAAWSGDELLYITDVEDRDHYVRSTFWIIKSNGTIFLSHEDLYHPTQYFLMSIPQNAEYLSAFIDDTARIAKKQHRELKNVRPNTAKPADTDKA